MLDIGMMEIFVIGALALIVVGPKELPGLLRTAGQMAAKVKGMAREFQRSMEEAAREADLGGVADAVKSGTDFKKKFSVENQIVDSVKEFQKTVKTEITETKAAFDATGAPVKSAPAAEEDPGQVQEAPKPHKDRAETPKVDAEAPKTEAEAPQAAAKEPEQKSA